MKIGVLSDTHGVIPEQVYTFFADCDQLWHAGDLGPGVLEPLRAFKPLRAVYGNMDDYALHYELPATDIFTCEGRRILMTHIGGWPDHYPKEFLKLFPTVRPDLFVCGHSHILRVMYDSRWQFLHINPGAAGRQGFHQKATLVRFTLDAPPADNFVHDLEILDFPKF